MVSSKVKAWVAIGLLGLAVSFGGATLVKMAAELANAPRVSSRSDMELVVTYGPSVGKLLLDTGGGGSGFIVAGAEGSQSTYIISNAHVCGDAETLRYSPTKAVSIIATVQYTDISKDLCLLSFTTATNKAPGLVFPPLPISGRNETYSWGVAIGYPRLAALRISRGLILGEDEITLMLPAGKKQKCSVGKERTLYSLLYGVGLFCEISFANIFTTILIKPGSSGSAVINENGVVIGVIQNSDEDDNAGMLPASTLRSFLDDARQRGYLR